MKMKMKKGFEAAQGNLSGIGRRQNLHKLFRVRRVLWWKTQGYRDKRHSQTGIHEG